MKENIAEKVISESKQEEQPDLELVTSVLKSLDLFTLSNSQIPDETKSSLLHDLVHLSLPNVSNYLHILNKPLHFQVLIA